MYMNSILSIWGRISLNTERIDFIRCQGGSLYLHANFSPQMPRLLYMYGIARIAKRYNGRAIIAPASAELSEDQKIKS